VFRYISEKVQDRDVVTIER